MSTLCFTGHRPDKLNGYNPLDNKKLLWALSAEIEEYIIDLGVDTFISGMALGVDIWAARIVLKLKEKYPNIKLICAIPCLNHPEKWKEHDQIIWNGVCDYADSVVYVTNEEYTPYCMQLRNQFMVDNSDYVLAVWDGSKGGTANCVNYANKKEKSVYILNPNDYK